MIGIYLNPDECDFVSKILCDKLAFYCRVPLTSVKVEEMDFIKSLLSKLDSRNLEVPPIYYPKCDYFVITGYSPVQKKRCVLGFYDDSCRALSAAIFLHDRFNYSDLIVRGVDINSIEIFDV